MEALCLHKSHYNGTPTTILSSGSSSSNNSNNNNSSKNIDGSSPCSLDFASISLSSLFFYSTLVIHLYFYLCAEDKAATATPTTADNSRGGGRGRRRQQHQHTAENHRNNNHNNDNHSGNSHGSRSTPPLHPAHTVVWLLLSAQLLLALAHAGEAALLLGRQGAALPVTLAEAATRLLASALAPLYFDSVERRTSSGPVLPLVMLYLGSCAVDGLRLADLPGLGFDGRHLLFVTTLGTVLSSASLFLLLVLGIAHRTFQRSLGRRRRHAAKDRSTSPGATKKPFSSSSWHHLPPESDHQFFYRYEEASLWSKLTFGWMLPLLRHGYRRPLEKDDLGRVPETERSRPLYEKLRGRLRPLHEGQDGILRACVRLNWRLVAAGGAFRLLADLFGFAGALSIKLVVDGMAEDFERMMERQGGVGAEIGGNVSSSSSPAEDSVTYHALTLEEFFSDSYVIAFAMFLAALGQVQYLLFLKKSVMYTIYPQ